MPSADAIASNYQALHPQPPYPPPSAPAVNLPSPSGGLQGLITHFIAAPIASLITGVPTSPQLEAVVSRFAPSNLKVADLALQVGPLAPIGALTNLYQPTPSGEA